MHSFVHTKARAHTRTGHQFIHERCVKLEVLESVIIICHNL